MTRLLHTSRCLLRFSSRRSYATVPEPPHQIASEWFAKVSAKGPMTRTQYFDANQLHLFALTINRAQDVPGVDIWKEPPKKGTPIPPGYHWIYFTVPLLEKELGIDGTDASYNPDAPFTRRMWAGGELHWVGGEKNPLRVGQEVKETTRMISADAKVTKTGDEMIVVRLDKEFENENGLALVDKRSWVFRKAFTEPQPLPPTPPAVPLPEGSITRDFCHTDLTLFRISCLTFNAHKIHWDINWCRNVEGHRSLVVHGPFSMLNMLNLWKDSRKEGESKIPEKLVYRNTSPVYAYEPHRAILEEQGNKKINGKIYGFDGTICLNSDVYSV